MGEVEISPRAYVKMCLHAARYPHVGVNGLLLAHKRRPTAGPAECLYITDCVPLFHSNLSLTVMLEVALNQVDSWSSESDLFLAGYYQAKSGMDDKSPTSLAEKTAARIADLCGEAVLIMAKVYSRLVDFDSHLDDIRQDWTNQQLNVEIAQLVSVANGSA
ncbi:hypothetical protein Chor_009692 [Crotalus horridus]